MKTALRKPAPAIEFDWIESAFPIERNSFRTGEVARTLSATVQHIFNLISEREIVVPEENLKRAPSRGSILIPRESLIFFLRTRTRLPGQKGGTGKAKQ